MKNLFKAIALVAFFLPTVVSAQPSGLGLRRDVGQMDTVFIINFNRDLLSNQVLSHSSSTLRMSIESPLRSSSPSNLDFNRINMVSRRADGAAIAANPNILENLDIFRFFLHPTGDYDGARRDRQRMELAGSRGSRIMARDPSNGVNWNFERDFPVETRTIFTYRWKIRIPDEVDAEGRMMAWDPNFNGTRHVGFNHLFQIKAINVSPISGNEAAGPMMTWSVVNGNRFRFIYTRLSCGGGSTTGIDIPMSRIRNRWLYKELTVHYSDDGYVHSAIWDINDPDNPERLGEWFGRVDTWRRPETSPCQETQLGSTHDQQIRPKWGLYRRHDFAGGVGEAWMDFGDATIIRRDYNTYIFPNGWNPRTRSIETTPNPDRPATAIALNKSAMRIMAGSRETLAATITPSNATNSTVAWTTSNASVATVSGGVVTAVGAGTATITARAGDHTATTTITVVPATSLDATRLLYVSPPVPPATAGVRNSTVRGSAGMVNSSNGGVWYVQHDTEAQGAVGSWFSIDADIPRRGNYRIEFIYQGGATRATVQPYIGLNPTGDFAVATAEANRIGSPICLRTPAPTPAGAANVSTLIGATGAGRDTIYYHRVLAESRELMRGLNTFTTRVIENPARWGHLPVQLVLTLIEEIAEDPSTIRRRQSSDNRFGIILENVVSSDFARFEVKTPNASLVNIHIMDNLGNTVFETNGRNNDVFVWNLTNNAGRFVGSGTYLIIAEAIDIMSGQVYVHYAKIGVRR